MKKYISTIRNNPIDHIILSSFSPTELGFLQKSEILEKNGISLHNFGNIIFCHLTSDILDNEKFLVRNFIDNGLKNFTFIGRGIEVVESDLNGYLITDHVNMSGKNPLRGTNNETYGVRFPDMSNTYKNSFLKDKLQQVKLNEGKLLIPANMEKLSEIEREVLDKYPDLKIISGETYFGVIIAKHAGISVNSLILKQAIQINSLFT
jgi:hypothetical protein